MKTTTEPKHEQAMTWPKAIFYSILCISLAVSFCIAIQVLRS